MKIHFKESMKLAPKYIHMSCTKVLRNKKENIVYNESLYGEVFCNIKGTWKWTPVKWYGNENYARLKEKLKVKHDIHWKVTQCIELT